MRWSAAVVSHSPWPTRVSGVACKSDMRTARAVDLPTLDIEELARAATHESPADDVDDDAQIVRETIAGIALRQTVGST